MPTTTVQITPHRAYRWGVRTVATAGPAALLMLLAWGLRFDPAVARPQLLLMLYITFLLTAAAGFCVATLAACHLAIARAFSAGYSTGATHTAVRVARQQPVLRVVGDDQD